MSPKLTVVYDACVLYPAPLRDLLMHLAITDLFWARWTEQIHDEWIRNVHANRPELSLERLQRTRLKMNESVLGSVVVAYEALIDGLTLPDPDDRHVLAAAIKSSASLIVTFNLVDFPADVLSPFGVSAIHPDAFIEQLLDANPTAVCEAVNHQRADLKKPPYTVEELLATLEKVKLPQTVARLREFIDLL